MNITNKEHGVETTQSEMRGKFISAVTGVTREYEVRPHKRQAHKCCGQTWGDLATKTADELLAFTVDGRSPYPWYVTVQCRCCGSQRSWQGKLIDTSTLRP